LFSQTHKYVDEYAQPAARDEFVLGRLDLRPPVDIEGIYVGYENYICTYIVRKTVNVKQGR
jgi:hypothetical protein